MLDIVAEKDHSCLILSDRLEHLKELMSLLPGDMKSKAVFISGKSKARERDKAMEDMRAGDMKYLFATYSLAKEGLDIPRLDRLFLVTPQKDYAVVTQSIGRIAIIFQYSYQRTIVGHSTKLESFHPVWYGTN